MESQERHSGIAANTHLLSLVFSGGFARNLLTINELLIAYHYS